MNQKLKTISTKQNYYITGTMFKYNNMYKNIRQ